MPLHFELVTPAALVRSEDVYSVTVPGSEGDFTVLEGHAPFMSTVKSGDLLITRIAGGEAERVVIEGGFAEVNEAGLTILAEKAG
jgi:F-type H+-transporting ATPase subunit epsilon